MRSRSAWPRFLALLLAVATGCGPASEHDARFLQFGTIVTIRAYDVTGRQFDAAIADLEEQFAELGRNWYPWADGELRHLNAAIAEGRAMRVSPALRRIVQTAAVFESRTGGRFNAGIGRLSELWGFHDLSETSPARPAAADIEAILAGGPGAASLTWEGPMLTAGHRQTMLDLGGIAKGALVAEGRRVLERHGIRNAIIDLGGDLAVIGNVRGRNARIGIRSPFGNTPIGGLEVRSGEAVFTSGNYERFVVIDGVRYPHVLDPRTGEPVRHTASATVIHDDPIVADAAATALLVAGAHDFRLLADSLELEYAMIVAASGDLRLTAAMRERLHWTDAGSQQ